MPAWRLLGNLFGFHVATTFIDVLYAIPARTSMPPVRRYADLHRCRTTVTAAAKLLPAVG
jgi:hypothetical protein